MLLGTGVAVVAGAVGFGAYARFGPAKAAAPTVPPAPTADPGTGAAGPPLAKLSDVPEHGGLVLPDQQVVLTRRTGTQISAFSAVCTHQQCLVTGVTATSISCPCHGSVFDAATGAVTAGPAPSPLPPVAVVIVGGVVRER